MKRTGLAVISVSVLFFTFAAVLAQDGGSPFYDFRAEHPGAIHKITVSGLPGTGSKPGVASPDPVPRPADAFPKTLPGFKVNLFATGLNNPREMRTAPNGDVFLAETDKGDIKVFRGVTNEGKPEQIET